MPIIVRDVSDELTLQHALVENLHRDDLNPLEEAAAYQQLIEDFGMTQEAVAHRVGKSRSAVANLLRLFQLPPQVQRLVADGQVSAGHAKALLGTPDRAVPGGAGPADRRRGAHGPRDRGGGPAAQRPRRPSARRPTAARPGSKLRAPGLLELEELLADQLDTRVKINMGPKRGRVVIEFADLEDLERIYRVMSPPPHGLSSSGRQPTHPVTAVRAACQWTAGHPGIRPTCPSRAVGPVSAGLSTHRSCPGNSTCCRVVARRVVRHR